MEGTSPHHDHHPAHAGHDATPAVRTLTIPTRNLVCEGCARVVEDCLRAHPDVKSVHVDLKGEVAHVTVSGDGAAEAELRRLATSACGEASAVPMPKAEVSSHQYMHDVHRRAPQARAPAEHARMAHGHHDMSDPAMAANMEADMRRRFWISLVLAIPVVLYSPLATNVFGLRLPAPFGVPHDWIMLAFSTPVALWASSVFHIGAWLSIRSGVLNMSVLVSLGILVSYVFSLGLTLWVAGQETYYEAAVMLAVFLLFGHWMEMKARRGSSDAVRKLLDLAPQQANVERDGRVTTVPVDQVRVGDTLVLKPGDRVPVDGAILDGETSVDESMVTGESLPVSKGPDDEVISGTINQSGSVRFRATKVGSETALAQIVAMVERAQNSKAPAQRLADRAAHYLVLVAVGSGLITFLIWFFVVREPVLLALTFAVTAVVIACPDALGLATPTAVMVATDLAAKRGVLFKEAVSLELASQIQAVIFDKTGTLTEGRPRVTDVIAAGGLSEGELLRLEAAAEARSGHPLAKAILDEAERRGLAVPQSVLAFESIAGHGVRARVDGREVLVGTRRLMERERVVLDGLAPDVERLLAEGKTLTIVAVDGKASGVVALADAIRPSAKAAVDGLRGLGLEVVMMTGDNRRTAEAVARALGIERVFAEVLPQDKSGEVRRLQAGGDGRPPLKVAMVGDGINDAPALAQADLGIAIGAGTDVAVETGNIVLMKSDPADVLAAIRISNATVRKMRQNLFWAAIYNLIAIPIAAGLLYRPLGLVLRPEFGALAMSASSITVVSNALLLRRERV